MPKEKPSKVVVHRIELQQTERDMVEAALAGRFVTNGVHALGNVLAGFGALLSPFREVLGALAVVWIGDRTLDAIIADGEKRKEEIEANYAELAPVHIAAISALLSSWYAEGGWDGICGDPDSMNVGAHLNRQVLDWIIENERGKGPYPDWFVDQVAIFCRTVCQTRGGGTGRTPADLWAGQPDPWMTPEYYGQAAYFADTGGSKWDAFWLGVRTLG
jgi:hypothetical protein